MHFCAYLQLEACACSACMFVPFVMSRALLFKREVSVKKALGNHVFLW